MTYCVVLIAIIHFHQFLDRIMPSLETYRKFRFCLYMKILEDSKSMSKLDAWEKWDKISDYDMRPREIEFLSLVVSKMGEFKINIFFKSINEYLKSI